MSELSDLQGQLTARRKEWIALYEQRPADLDPAAHAAELRRRNDELTELATKIEPLAELDALAKAHRAGLVVDTTPVPSVPFPTDGSPAKADAPRPRSIGEQFVESAGYKRWQQQPRVQGNVATVEVPGVDFKTTFTTTAATVTGYDRSPAPVLLGTQRPTVADLLARGETTQNTIRYLREDTFTNAATTVAEGDSKPEAAFDTSEVDAPVRKIAVTAKVTDEIFNDFPAIRAYINERLPLMVALAEDSQLLTGDGNAPNLTGLLNVSGILTQAKGSDPTPDAVYKAMVQVMSTGFFMPDGAVFHPLDWQDVKLLRTADGLYIWGSPAEAAPDRIWGLNVVLTTSITQNTALVGAFKLGAQVFYRAGITVEATNTNSDDFVKNLITIRAEQREALAVYRPKAFCTVTGI